MPILFSELCVLLQSLENIKLKDPPLLREAKKNTTERTIRSWFASHRRALETSNGASLLSCLFPEKRTDRVYGIQAARLSRIISRSLFFNAAKFKQLELWKIAGNGDLGVCIERTLREFDCEPKPGLATVDQIDIALEKLASHCEFSSPEISTKMSQKSPIDILQPLYMKCTSMEAKWLTRLILKDFSPVVFDQYLVQSSYHFLLPFLLQFSDSFHVACTNLQGPLKIYHPNPDTRSQEIFLQQAAKSLIPLIGTKVGRSRYHQARSIEQCLHWCSSSQWSVERKLDGEFCEIHINMSQGIDGCIKTFSKRGKDSTQGLRGVHDVIRRCLRIGQPECRFREQCIVIGELLVYDDHKNCIAPFHKLRAHVSRGPNGRYIGQDPTNKPQPHEHLMIAFHDILLLDAYPLINQTYDERRRWLRTVVKKEHGRAITTPRKILDFSRPEATGCLIQHFAVALAERAEGLILKPVDQPYVCLKGSAPGTSNFKGIIKLKKDYIATMGDERDSADLAIVGASYNGQKAGAVSLKSTKWTDFFLGCLKNPDDVRFGRKPVYVIVGRISVGERCIPPVDLATLNHLGQFRELQRQCSSQPSDAPFDIDCNSNQHSAIEILFKEPFIAEVLGSGYEKPPGMSFYMLRHPRILKLHEDRDGITFAALQQLARQSIAEPLLGEKEETKRLIALMERRARDRKIRNMSVISSLPSGKDCKKLLSPLQQTPLSTSSASLQPRSSTCVITPCPSPAERTSRGKEQQKTRALASSPCHLGTHSTVWFPSACSRSPLNQISARELLTRDNTTARPPKCNNESHGAAKTLPVGHLDRIRQKSRKRLSDACAQRDIVKRTCLGGGEYETWPLVLP